MQRGVGGRGDKERREGVTLTDEEMQGDRETENERHEKREI